MDKQAMQTANTLAECQVQSSMEAGGSEWIALIDSPEWACSCEFCNHVREAVDELEEAE